MLTSAINRRDKRRACGDGRGKHRSQRGREISGVWGKAIGDRDGDTDRQCAPALHYTGYLVQTVCEYEIMKQVSAAGANKRQPHLKKYGVGRALPRTKADRSAGSLL